MLREGDKVFQIARFRLTVRDTFSKGFDDWKELCDTIDLIEALLADFSLPLQKSIAIDNNYIYFTSVSCHNY